MAIKFSELVSKSRELFGRVATDQKTKDAIEFTKETATEASKQGKGFLKTEMGKHMVIPAAIGALIAIPIPFIGPLFGALIGAAYGYYQYSIRPTGPSGLNTTNDTKSSAKEKVDVYAELAKLDVLKRSGTLSEKEFSDAKKQLLKANK